MAARPTKNWIQTVKTTSVYEGPPGTMGTDKKPADMARVLLRVNPTKTKGSILRYMQYVINRAGRTMSETQRNKIKRAMQIVRESKHEPKKENQQ